MERQVNSLISNIVLFDFDWITRFPAVVDVLKQFPWGKMEKDGTFHFDIVVASFGVLGQEGYGYWAHKIGPNMPEIFTGLFGPQEMSRLSTLVQSSEAGFQNGALLLSDEWISEGEGWKLRDDKLIPWLPTVVSSDSSRWPELASDNEITYWDNWYRWRKLDKESPAALLMHYPLSIYQLLVHVLHVANPKWGAPKRRQKLIVHYLGAGVELNMLPLCVVLSISRERSFILTTGHI